MNYPPKIAVSRVVNSLKLVSSKLIRKKNIQLSHTLWSDSL
ncbi:hypothetical protein PRO82_000758 [Candidatus Protochlamydia amoebophila]|nr:hypothetical protein [Candidatus Protochlamydia amoebophila]